MASGTINGTTSNEYVACKIEWSSVADNANNRSALTYKFYARRIANGWTGKTYGTLSLTIKVDGTSYNFSGYVELPASGWTQKDWTLITSGTVNVSHSTDGSKSCSISATGGMGNSWSSTSLSGTAVLDNIPRASTLKSFTSSVTTGDKQAIYVDRKSASYYHKVRCYYGNTLLYTSSAFGTGVSFTVPRTWLSNKTTATSISVTFKVQTYTNSNCTTAVGAEFTGTFTVKADSDMKPSPGSGWATATPYNTGTAAANINAFVQGYSKARIAFDSSKVDMSNTAGASISSYAVIHGSNTDDSSPYYTGVLAKTSQNITCKVTDSRGRTAQEVIEITAYAYSKPTLSGIEVYRCNSSGAASDTGAFCRVKASCGFSSIGGRNSCSISVTIKHGSSTIYSGALTSGQAAILGGSLSSQQSYTVTIVATDALGNTAKTTEVIPTEEVAIDALPENKGVAFGKRAEEENTVDIKSGWKLKLGQTVLTEAQLQALLAMIS